MANDAGEREIPIRDLDLDLDLDRAVIGNPVHDLIRLSLPPATAARRADLPGIVTARTAEAVHEGWPAPPASSRERAPRAAIARPSRGNVTRWPAAPRVRRAIRSSHAPAS